MVLAVSSAAAVIAPPVLTMAADRYGRGGALFLFVLATSAIALSVFAFVGGYWWVAFVYAAFSLAREPTRPLLDGIFFSSQRHIPVLAAVKRLPPGAHLGNRRLDGARRTAVLRPHRPALAVAASVGGRRAGDARCRGGGHAAYGAAGGAPGARIGGPAREESGEPNTLARR